MGFSEQIQLYFDYPHPQNDHPTQYVSVSIALCNVVAKVVGKVLATRLKSVLPSVISESHSVFVPQRLIMDNVLLSFEAHHFLKNQRLGKKGFMSIKLDMLKAYDRIEWSFLRAMLIKLDFSVLWVKIIMDYVTLESYSVLVNGDQTGYIKPSRGIRQGDPLSPYLFIICTEGLIALIRDACLKGTIKGIKLGAMLEHLSHLLFANDTLLLGEATVEEALSFKAILSQYEEWSGQKVSIQKSSVVFSPNVQKTNRDAITNILGMPEVATHGKYLGLPTIIGGSKKAIFTSPVERVKLRIVDWKQRILSKAGKEVWRLLIEPTSVLAKVFKAKYFSDEDYWTASMGPKSSFTWRSLISVRNIMKQAIRWKTGDGKTIRIWEDNWLNHTWLRKHITPTLEDFPNATVSDLIDKDIGTWNISKVRSGFYNVDSKEILKISLNNLNQADTLLWGPHQKGCFSVKTAYEFIHTLSQETSSGPTTSNSQRFNYKKFWKIKIQGKIKHFLWRALYDNLATSNKLRQRKVEVQQTFILCGIQEETVVHVLHLCRFTNRLLKITHIIGREISFQDLFELGW
ncbi:hypothetical protein LIER_11950 [Lithospermum erythrorhizon]|uniref:Reverse transcriptase domain-containing protein n=1 Tax=Lithospermum erythrorhizon TaxID=34254 RepID=A0AAV3PRS4_LITER